MGSSASFSLGSPPEVRQSTASSEKCGIGFEPTGVVTILRMIENQHESEGAYESVVLSLPVHTATHVDLVSSGNRIVPRRMIGAGKLLDITKAPEDETG